MTLALATVTACATTTSTAPSSNSASHRVQIEQFTFRSGEREPIPVYWASGREPGPNTRILVICHGTERNPAAYLAAWLPLLKGHDVVAVAPEFDRFRFPDAAGYNLGGMVDTDGRARPERDWTFGYIEPLVEEMRSRTGSTAPTFDLFGHSAGAQFVHRYLTYQPQAPVGRAVAANAGWYTVPDEGIGFPYGLADSPGPSVDLDHLLGADLIVMLGGDDTADENLRQAPEAMAQGATRVERGHHYFEVGRDLAADRGITLGWTLMDVPGVGHDQAQMAQAAAPLLLP